MQALYYWEVNRTCSFRLGLAFQDRLTVNRLTDNIPNHCPLPKNPTPCSRAFGPKLRPPPQKKISHQIYASDVMK